ncbi:hypothetical protein JOC86_004628 [Bacillus pakistanensis]|uniref:Uncharacterized protein n=1 Tax=Rossellomorea pakistanensis TaxID=992288 RepID=A0ABS2NJR2_9BACI|nr:hypothetical protein [Bacillus pakistanensis]MBM7588053.1 hypothetical protein [Bacillus pakistanensis]
MRKILFSIIIGMISLIILPSSSIAITKDPILQSIDSQLTEGNHYYRTDSVKLLDFKDLYLEVYSADGKTTTTEKIKVLFIQYQETRDTLFHFEKGDIFYYNLDKGVLLSPDMVGSNEEIKSFIDKHEENIKKHITTGSFILLFSLIVLCVFIIPLAAAIFHRNYPSSNT